MPVGLNQQTQGHFALRHFGLVANTTPNDIRIPVWGRTTWVQSKIGNAALIFEENSESVDPIPPQTCRGVPVIRRRNCVVRSLTVLDRDEFSFLMR